jgi:hypothetical protein
VHVDGVRSDIAGTRLPGQQAGMRIDGHAGGPGRSASLFVLSSMVARQ